MSSKQGTLNFADMISWLRDEFTKDGYVISDICEEYPPLPIDLFCTKGKGKTQECCIVIVAAIDHISEDFQKRLFFYQYLMSLHYKPSQYKIILAVPEYATIVTTPFYAEEEKEKRQDFYKENGFGLWRIRDKDNIDKETCGAITLRDKIARDFENVIAKEHKELIDRKTVILPFVDRYVHDSVLGIAEYYGIKFDERNVDQKLLERMLDLKKVPYKDRLFNLVNEHLSKKTKNDFDFCTDTFNELWSEYLGVEIYPEEHRNLEPLLAELYPRYRDHYIHQLQVFLLGVLIIDILIDNKKIIESKSGFPSISWLLASSFHDFAYPIQKCDDYFPRFLKECLGTVDNWRFLGFLQNDYTESSFSSDVEHIIASLANCFTEDCKGETGARNFNIIRQFLYRGIAKDKNHGLIGSLGLLKRFRDNSQTDFTNVVLPAAVAVALHDPEVCQRLNGSRIDTKDECVSLVQRLAPLRRLDFERQPLAFLLILCDNIQDWGRHFKDEEQERRLKEANIRLKNLLFESGRFTIQLFFNDTRESRKFMSLKEQMLEGMEKLLNSSDIEFVIEYWNREKDEPTTYKFRIGGGD